MGKNEAVTRKKVVGSFFWRFAERTGAQGVTFIVSLVLARILLPETYGTIALITVFISILNVFVDSGLGNALEQKKDADDLDFSSVFYFNIFACTLLYIGVYFAAPLIALFYDDVELTPVIRVLSLTIVISGVKNVQQAYVGRNLLFKRFFFATLIGTIGAAVIGIAMAYGGYGIWAIVAQQLFNITVDTIILWITVKWRPKRMFSWERLKGLLSYGWKLLISTLIDTIYNEVRQLIIGKMYSSADLAYYNRGKQFPSVIITNINVSINSVLLPTMSRNQDDRTRLKDMTRRAIKTSIYVMAPLMMGLAFCAEPVVRLLITDKWIESVPYLRIFCIVFMFYPIHTANLNAIKAMGRSDTFLKLEIIKKIVGVALLLSTMWFGVMAMAYSLLFSTLLSMIINSWPNRKLLDYPYLDQMKDILPSILLAVIMGACILPIQLLGLNSFLTLLIQVLAGALIYVIGSYLTNNDSFYYIMESIKTIKKRNNS